ncbi:MAG: ATP-dependent DNA helicase RecG [Candidatus Paceibacteria bacterium]|jgi:ATP-dependent DNA helicase RecG
MQAESTSRVSLQGSVTDLKGVGPARAALLEGLGIDTLGDLVFHTPRGLESSGTASTIAAALAAKSSRVVVFSGEVASKRFNRFGRRSTLRLVVREDGAELEVTYFNQSWQRERFKKGKIYTFAGRVVSATKGALVIAPRAAEGKDSLPVDQWIPIYGVTEGLGQRLLRSLIAQALEQVGEAIHEPLEQEVLKRLDLPDLPAAVQALHEPASQAEFARAGRRVLLRDLIAVQTRVLARTGSQATAAEAFRLELAQDEDLALDLPFELTAGQQAILEQFDRDLASGEPMRRLLQGDVGAGKTVLALLTCARIAAAGAQSAFMAPTELLAEQHYFGSREQLQRAGVQAELLTGSMPGGERRKLLARLKSGAIDVLFGTHALFSQDVRYRRLALCVIDEQQRFGVAQRSRLLEKGGAAHLLLMTATPIPRTLALTLYGNLKVGTLRDRPPGRGKIKTRWLRARDGERLPEFLRERLSADERMYWVCPRIGSPETGGAEAAYERLAQSELGAYGVALVHGQLDRGERSQRLDAFRRGDVQCLVATTVIEVGVDVPEATVIVIEEAERLGLAQLHQLRGRVGRGSKDSWCLLFGKEQARERIEVLERSCDGFEIAEEDLRSRGMGELAGLRQSGDFAPVLGGLEDHLDLLLAARELVARTGDLDLR